MNRMKLSSPVLKFICFLSLLYVSVNPSLADNDNNIVPLQEIRNNEGTGDAKSLDNLNNWMVPDKLTTLPVYKKGNTSESGVLSPANTSKGKDIVQSSRGKEKITKEEAEEEDEDMGDSDDNDFGNTDEDEEEALAERAQNGWNAIVLVGNSKREVDPHTIIMDLSTNVPIMKLPNKEDYFNYFCPPENEAKTIINKNSSTTKNGFFCEIRSKADINLNSTQFAICKNKLVPSVRTVENEIGINQMSIGYELFNEVVFVSSKIPSMEFQGFGWYSPLYLKWHRIYCHTMQTTHLIVNAKYLHVVNSNPQDDEMLKEENGNDLWTAQKHSFGSLPEVTVNDNGIKFVGFDMPIKLQVIRLAPIDDFFFWFDKEAARHQSNKAYMWSHIYKNRWLNIEKSVREYAASSDAQLKIITGTYRYLQLNGSKYVLGGELIPDTFWKLVYNTKTTEYMFIVTSNDPFLNSAPDRYSLCSNELSRQQVVLRHPSKIPRLLNNGPLHYSKIRCKRYGWLLDSNDVQNGITYCCKLTSAIIEKIYLPKKMEIGILIRRSRPFSQQSLPTTETISGESGSAQSSTGAGSSSTGIDVSSTTSYNTGYSPYRSGSNLLSSDFIDEKFVFMPKDSWKDKCTVRSSKNSIVPSSSSGTTEEDSMAEPQDVSENESQSDAGSVGGSMIEPEDEVGDDDLPTNKRSRSEFEDQPKRTGGESSKSRFRDRR